jgi:transcriptional regulator with XRE-family HTH domain
MKLRVMELLTRLLSNNMRSMKNNNKKIELIDKHIGKRIKERRIQNGMSQIEVSSQLGVSFQQLQKYEKGKSRIPISRIYKLLNILDVKLEYFFEGITGFLSEENDRFSNFDNISKKENRVEIKKLNVEILRFNRLFKKIKDKGSKKLIMEIMRVFVRAENEN